MKAILLLSLLFVCVFTEETAPVAQSNDIIDIIKCFIGKEEIITDIKDIIEIIKSGDYSKLITIAFKVYADVTAAIKECVPQEIELEGFIFSGYKKCVRKCKKDETYQTCRDDCRKKFPKKELPIKPKGPCVKTCKRKGIIKKCTCKPITPVEPKQDTKPVIEKVKEETK